MKYFPVIKISIVFSIGIIVASFINFSLELLLVLSISFLFLQILLFKIFDIKWINLLAYTFIFLLGITQFSLHQNSIEHYKFPKQKYRKAITKGKITQINLINKDKLVCFIECDSISVNKYKTPVNSLARISIFDSRKNLLSIYDSIRIGNYLEVLGTISKPNSLRNPGGFNYNNYLHNKGISYLVSCYNVEDIKVKDNNYNKFYQLVLGIRKSIDDKIKKLYNDRSSAFLRSIILGDKNNLDPELKEDFIYSGSAHILALSGLHVGIISLIVFIMTGRLEIRIRLLINLLFLSCFLLISGGSPSVTRAVIMASVLIISVLLNRNYNAFNSISIAGLIILLYDPNEIFDAGFQLSFMAVISIIIFYPILIEASKGIFINGLLQNVKKLVVLTISAQILIIPLIIFYFHSLSISSVIVNLFIIPVLGIVLGIGVLSVVLSFLSIAAAEIFAISNSIIIEYIFYVTKVFANLSYTILSIRSFSTFDIVVYYFLSIILGFTLIGKYIKHRFFITLLLVISCIYLVGIDDYNIFNKKLNILFLDVGQGDAALIVFPNNKTMLIDAGNSKDYYDNGKRTIQPLLKSLGIDKIDYGVITHFDSDHYGGFRYLCNEGIIRKLLLPDVISKDLIRKKNIEILKSKISFAEKSIMEIGDSRIYILNDYTKDKYNIDKNSSSICMKVQYGDFSVLLTGDAGIGIEELLSANYNSFLESNILKLGHHGSKTSSSERFLNTVNPNYAIISCGIENKFKHPSKEVIHLLETRKIKAFRTDEEGLIWFESSGVGFSKVDWRELNL